MDLSFVADGAVTATTAYAIHLLVRVLRNPRAIGSWLPQVLLGWHRSMNEVEEARRVRINGETEEYPDLRQAITTKVADQLVAAAEQHLNNLQPVEVTAFGAGDPPGELRD